MGYNSNCTDQNCSQGCCNVYGNCPQTSYSSSSLSKCKYYYSQSQPLDSGSTAGVIAGPIIGFIIIFIIIVCCIKKCREKKALEAMNNQNIATQNYNKANKNQINNNQINMTTQQLATELLASQRRIAQLLEENIMLLENGDRNVANDYIESIGYHRNAER